MSGLQGKGCPHGLIPAKGKGGLSKGLTEASELSFVL